MSPQRTHCKSYILWLRPSVHARLMRVREETGRPVSHWLRQVLLAALDDREAGRE